MFDDIRPYYDSEINAAMRRIAADPLFPTLAAFVFPGRDAAEVAAEVSGIDNSRDFQVKIMYQANRRIIQMSTDGFTCSGQENIARDGRYLYVSNHRDIMLDAALLQNVLIDMGLDTSEISFGANLMQPGLVVDIGNSNKMYKVERPGKNIRDFYRASTHLSDYIRMTLLSKGQSVWIAQRNGRTKDGNDKTDTAIIKMFSMSRSDDQVKSIAELNILPVSVSYEWEPCDILKAVELCRREEGPYVKQPGEDLNSILSGIMQPKGRVHFEICRPITTDDIAPFGSWKSTEFNRAVASILDHRICEAYMLYPNNFIAHDLRSGTRRYMDKYTAEQKEIFVTRMEKLFEPYSKGIDMEKLRLYFLGIYANPVDNRKSRENKK